MNVIFFVCECDFYKSASLFSFLDFLCRKLYDCCTKTFKNVEIKLKKKRILKSTFLSIVYDPDFDSVFVILVGMSGKVARMRVILCVCVLFFEVNKTALSW